MKMILLVLATAAIFFAFGCTKNTNNSSSLELKQGFQNPPDWARPGVYWYFMDGNMTKEAITADLESMKKVGIGHVLFLEVNVGVPRGKVDFLSEEWQNLFQHIVRESERLGIAITLGVGPGWTGSGGPWIPGEQSMKHLVSSVVQVSGGQQKTIVLPKPELKKPYFGMGAFTEELSQKWKDYYEDVAVLAFPTPEGDFKISDIDEKALYYREPFTSKPGVKQFLSSVADYTEPDSGGCVSPSKIVDLTQFLKPDGTLEWEAPQGKWTIMRFGSTNNGAVTRPAPLPGVGFEADKFDTAAINFHLENFTGKLLNKIGIPDKNKQGGLKTLHMDSWEMGAQNWTEKMREEFMKRRGYDPPPYYPVYAGFVVGSLEKSERFLWDLRLTGQELVVENHAKHLKNYAHKYNMNFSVEPYDMNPTADMELGAVADVPMCEFWSKGYGYNASFSCIQAASIAHVEGKNVVAAEAFTAHLDAWKQYPGSMKNQGDWAFATGINRLVYHTYQHQCLPENLKPGMTMGPYGVHHNRSQTWWPMADGYHTYISRCQYMLQQGKTVADILYLTPEGAPHVFRAPASALTTDIVTDSVEYVKTKQRYSGGETGAFLPDRKGYSFDGCSPSQLMTATVENGKVRFPSGASYQILVLPATETMTPALLAKIESLVKDGATIIGNPPRKSPGLVNYPECDKQVAEMAKTMWGNDVNPAQITKIKYGNGVIYHGGSLSGIAFPELYPNYETTAEILREKGIPEDFSGSESVRYIHQVNETGDVYFVSNKTNQELTTKCSFRVKNGTPQFWNPMTGETRELPEYEVKSGVIEIPLQFEAYESYFIVFNQKEKSKPKKGQKNFEQPSDLMEVNGQWTLSFDPKWGGPDFIVFDTLGDWTTRPEEGIKYYSGIVSYRNTVNIPANAVTDKNAEIFMDLGEVCNLARVYVNGKDMGVVWAAPYRLKISDAVLAGENQIDIEVANLWPNRLIGDEKLPDDGIKNGKWPDWLLNGTPRTSGRYTFATFRHYKADSTLLKSGLIGPVKILSVKKN